MKRNIYLKMKSLEEAQDIFFKAFDLTGSLGAETIPASGALGRVTAGPVIARVSSPGFHVAAMDGIAVNAADTFGARDDAPATLVIGQMAGYINTGHVLPEGTNAVIMIEQVTEISPDRVSIRQGAYPWQNVRKVGEDIVAKELLFPQNHYLGPYEIGALLGSGNYTVEVKVRPKVAVIPTGSELIHLSSDSLPLPRGKVIEYNSAIIAALVTENHGVPEVYPIVPDDYAAIKAAVVQALESDAHLIIINAGSSAGSEDYTAAIISELGEVMVHGVTIMPGKPTILGRAQGKPVVGNPGYPVSAVISFEQFIGPMLWAMQGQASPKRPQVSAIMSRKVPSKLGVEEFLRVKLGRIGDRVVATPVGRGAGSITTLTHADGMVRVPALSEGIIENKEVKVELFRRPEEIENTVVVIGSHDMTLDILANLLKCHPAGVSLSSSNVGSMGGLIAIKKGIAHLAGTHLLDPETGEYNISYLKRHLAGVGIKLVTLVYRDQGLIVARGNPKGITSLKDLIRSDVSFTNRQAGSGTRVLLDFKLQTMDLDRALINGYDREEYTHMSVAVDVLSGRSDAGLGIAAAARALDLDFIPIIQERYDLVIPAAFYDTPMIQAVLSTITSPAFKSTVAQMGGYDPSPAGHLVMELD
ncbi:MAG: molybdopterin biosynthesis protein [Deltaproteobacteria bacterium]|nr:molybdopterin biosynthesis protein [Deltaproteobacteria bacterium]